MTFVYVRTCKNHTVWKSGYRHKQMHERGRSRKLKIRDGQSVKCHHEKLDQLSSRKKVSHFIQEHILWRPFVRSLHYQQITRIQQCIWQHSSSDNMTVCLSYIKCVRLAIAWDELKTFSISKSKLVVFVWFRCVGIYTPTFFDSIWFDSTLKITRNNVTTAKKTRICENCGNWKVLFSYARILFVFLRHVGSNSVVGSFIRSFVFFILRVLMLLWQQRQSYD